MSLQQRIAVFFAHNPEEELMSSDVGVKFGLKTEKVGGMLATARRQGIVSMRIEGQGYTRRAVWSAGPELLRQIGAVK